MITDQSLSRLLSLRQARDPATDLLVRAWTGADPSDRAAMLVAEDDTGRAGLVGGAPFDMLARGEVPEVLEHVRSAQRLTPALRIAEAEALLAAGAIRAGLEVLQELHQNAYAPGTLALARRTLQLGDAARANRVAAQLPRHVHAVVVRVRAALATGRGLDALLGLEPFLEGTLPAVPAAAGLAALAASVLAKVGARDKLMAFARGLLDARDLPAMLLPGMARVAWTAGLGAEAWRRVQAHDESDPFTAAARLELAVLSGDRDSAERAGTEAGALASASAEARALLSGNFPRTGDLALLLAKNDPSVHVWRTSGERYAAWLCRVVELPARVSIFDLAQRILPQVEEVPDLAIDDAALPSLIDPGQIPISVPARLPLYVHPKLCQGVALGLDMTAETLQPEQLGIEVTSVPEKAGLIVAPASEALKLAAVGRACIAIAIPGDPYWLGPVPERSFAGLRVLRSHPADGWKRAGEALATAIDSLLSIPVGGEL